MEKKRKTTQPSRILTFPPQPRTASKKNTAASHPPLAARPAAASSPPRPLPPGSLSSRRLAALAVLHAHGGVLSASADGTCGFGGTLDACFVASSSPPASAPRRCSAVVARRCTIRVYGSASSSPPPPRRKTRRDRRRPLRPCRDSGGCKQQLRAPAKRLKPLGKIFRRVRLTATKGDPASLDENNGTSPESSPKSPRDQQFQLHH